MQLFFKKSVFRLLRTVSKEETRPEDRPGFGRRALGKLLDSLAGLVEGRLVDEDGQVAAIGGLAADSVTDAGAGAVLLDFGDLGGNGGLLLHVVELVIHDVR